MSIQSKSEKLKALVATYNSDWLLGDFSSVIHAGRHRADDQLGQLSSPMRQLVYLAGLNVTSEVKEEEDCRFTHEKWNEIVRLLNEIENEYGKLFLPENVEDISEEWRRVLKVSMPSFLAYFNQGILNYEEQIINWIRDLFGPLSDVIENAVGVSTEEFILFYNTIDKLLQNNFQAHGLRKDLLRPNWEQYSKIKMGVPDDVPDFIKEMGEENKHVHIYMADPGIKDRFLPEEIVSENLSVDKIEKILNLLSIRKEKSDFLFYTSTNPGNPLFTTPILQIGNGQYQVFQVMQVIIATRDLLEKVCSNTQADLSKYISLKGKVLEKKVADLFKSFFDKKCEVYQGYYVDGKEQDLLVLWKDFAFIIETKGYTLREPLRDPEKAFTRIKDDFKASIGYAYTQTRRIEKYFIQREPLKIFDKDGKIIRELDTASFEQDFSIIVNLNSFGQVQCDLSALISLEYDDDVHPWAVQLDDLETFLLTMKAKKKTPKDFVDFLFMRETLHGKLVCSDELEVCGGFLEKKLIKKQTERSKTIVTKPFMGDIFDKQYHKTMGFRDEKYLYEKQSGKFMFW